MIRLIKRYESRKLYDTEESRYVSLDEIAQWIRQGQEVKVVDNATGRCVGEAVLNRWEPASQSCSFRIALTAAGRGRGLGTEALRLLVGHGFEQLGLHRISLTVYAFNVRGRRSYEKAGFVLEGTRRQALRYGEEWVDAGEQ